VLDSFADFELLVEQGERTGCFPDYTHIWWDIRPHPQLGTIEIRICDAQTRIENVAAIVALVQSLAAAHGSNFDCGITPAVRPTMLIEEKQVARAPRRPRRSPDRPGGRHGALGARGDLGAGREVRARRRGARLRRRAGLVASILLRGNGADEQRRLYSDPGDLDAVAWWLAEQTLVSDTRIVGV